MTDDACPCCGQTLPPKAPAITGLSPIQQAIFNTLAAAGRNGVPKDRLFLRVYGHRRDGGPMVGSRIIGVHISNIRKKLPPEYRIKSDGCACNPGSYFLTRAPSQ